MADRTEVRGEPRYTANRLVRIVAWNGQAVSGTMRNVSRGGMLVEVPIELELGRTYQIEASDRDGVFRLPGEALRLHLPPPTPDSSQPGGFRIGFEFMGTDPATGERLRRLVEETAT